LSHASLGAAQDYHPIGKASRSWHKDRHQANVQRTFGDLGGVTHMRRRDFIILLGGAAVVQPLAARAQQRMGLRRIGILMPYPESDAEVQARVRAFRDELRKLGWVDGDNLTFDVRWATDSLERVRAQAAELVAFNSDVILTTGSRVVPLVQQQTRSIPIVFVGTSDPVGQGLVASLARPGGNTTGFSLSEFAGPTSPIIGKMLEILKEIAPDIARVALMFNAANPATAFHSRSFQAATATMGIQPTIIPIQRPAEIESAIAAFAGEPNGGMLFPSDLTLLAHRELVTGLVTRHRLPAIFADRVIVASGGLISYSADRTDMFRRAASYVDRILRGEKPGDLPVQQPTRYELVINVKAAQALGLAVPPALMIRADEVIE
jgi:putative ABC transport system substrate-binding protein